MTPKKSVCTYYLQFLCNNEIVWKISPQSPRIQHPQCGQHPPKKEHINQTIEWKLRTKPVCVVTTFSLTEYLIHQLQIPLCQLSMKIYSLWLPQWYKTNLEQCKTNCKSLLTTLQNNLCGGLFILIKDWIKYSEFQPFKKENLLTLTPSESNVNTILC